MGREATCECKWAGATATVKALLETSELILRGEMRRKVSFAELKQVAARADCLTFEVAGDRVALFLGNDQAVKWEALIKAGPTSLAKKLGIGPESIVRTIGSIDDEALEEALAQAAGIASTKPKTKPTLIVARISTPKDLASALAKAHAETAAGTPIWLIYPKGPGHPLSENMIRAVVLPTGLVDSKVAAVSIRLTAIRFNQRRAK